MRGEPEFEIRCYRASITIYAITAIVVIVAAASWIIT